MHRISKEYAMDADPIVPEAAIVPLLLLLVIFIAGAIYYCVKTELKNRKMAENKVDVEAGKEAVLVKNISGKSFNCWISL